MQVTRLSCSHTAMLVRLALKRAFPTIKFTVKSKTYHRSPSINVGWTDGPTKAMVDGVISVYAGSRFDASIELKTTVSSWLMPDGSATLASDRDWNDDGGNSAAYHDWMPHSQAQLVQFGTDCVFTNRRMSPAFAARALASFTRRYGDMGVSVVISNHDGSASLSGPINAERLACRAAQRFMSVAG